MDRSSNRRIEYGRSSVDYGRPVRRVFKSGETATEAWYKE